MLKTIKFSQSQKKKEEQIIANFLAQTEYRDFNTIFSYLDDSAQNSYLFHEIDLQKYYDMIMEEVKAKHYDNNEKLTSQAVNNIIKKYSETMDIDQFVPTLKKLGLYTEFTTEYL